MKTALACFAVAFTVISFSVSAQKSETVPQFQVDALWPKPLPNKWILGQVSGIATDKYDRIWVVHRPGSLTPREKAAEATPPEAKCCVAAPPVLVFDQSGNFLFSWGGPGSGYQWPASEHGIYVDADVRSGAGAVAAVHESGALHPHLAGRQSRVRVRPHAQPVADLPQGWHLRLGAHVRAGNARQRFGVRPRVLARRRAAPHLHGR